MRAFEGRAGSALCALRKVVAVAAIPLLVAGCFPSTGPGINAIVAASSNKANTSYRQKQKAVFDIVDMDQNVASIVSAYRSPSFNKTFGLGGGGGNPTIGVGDIVQITIFEAGPDGLFSTQDNKATNVTVTVQPDGRAPVPYIGSVQFAGNTLESVRGSIVEALKTRAVEPDVIVTLSENASRTVAVNGVVGKPSLVPLGLSGERLTEVIAKAGGPTNPPYDTFVTLTRGGRTGKALLQTLIERPKENVYARPGDQLFLTHDPQTFSALGSTGKSAQIPLGAASINVIEAAALAGGANPERANPKGLFVFRYEYGEVLRSVLGEERFRQLASKGMHANGSDMYPIVYRIDLSQPDSYLVGQNFPIRNKDVIYLAQHPTVEIIRFMTAITQTVVVARGISSF
ncbi:polysaccharide biosynthesis/export family protein [Mesorhizobium sp. LHD-90]|uniref:polysaccharide biosynthesis/export family protein n=1 Tax=Mesorhizobium sp. LHD-90 TaxID=3071414 RepID=UPI0027DFEEC3|nr:polysaccharide biosynthesis/export family protein [Mesorhizobium sp. LHD-90]MDQ6436225.1 polysaccharide biosynthesis/export family protein [Mesorhizobium sp. LHD-90]